MKLRASTSHENQIIPKINLPITLIKYDSFLYYLGKYCPIKSMMKKLRGKVLRNLTFILEENIKA